MSRLIADNIAGSRPTSPGSYAPVIGKFQDCPHTLIKWFEDEDENGKTTYFARAYPCTVHHGWYKSPKAPWRMNKSLGKKGEHKDALGRIW